MIKNRCAFTLIELLIVVAIIAILAAIAVPNFLEAQVRSKVARTKADMRSLVTAVESYAVDNNKPPVRHAGWNAPPFQSAGPLPEKIYDPVFPSAAVGMHVMTTPIAYMTSLPRDVFNWPVAALMLSNPAISDAIDYWDARQGDEWIRAINNLTSAQAQGRSRGYLLISVGPDSYLGLPLAGNFYGYPPHGAGSSLSNTLRWLYDPTNGTVSPGNIMRFAGGLEQVDIYPL